nr:immunoglobulin light chain junction region [Macaca mulatta]
CQQHNTSPYSF